MRILMLSMYPNIKGPIPKITPHLVSTLRSLGCTVVTEPWGRHHDIESLGSKIVGRAQDIVRIRRTLCREVFGVMVIHTSHDWATLSRDILLLLVARRLCRRIVLHFHGSEPGRLLQAGTIAFKRASALLLHLSDAALVLSSEEQRQWERFYPAGKFFVVNNPFVPATIDTATAPMRPWNLPPRVAVLLFVGRLISGKGIFDLLEAVARLKERLPCHLLVVGDGAGAPQVKNEIVRLELTHFVTLTGYLTGDELVEAYQVSDVFILPTYLTEGFPTVIAEAMGAGLPIVTTRIRGAADHLREGVNALFVSPRDPVTLSKTLRRLLTDPTLRAKMVQANREKVKEFAPQVVGQQYFDVLEHIVGKATR